MQTYLVNINNQPNSVTNSLDKDSLVMNKALKVIIIIQIVKKKLKNAKNLINIIKYFYKNINFF